MINLMDLKISFKSQFYALREIIIISIVYFGLLCLLYLKAEFGLFKVLFFATFIFYLIVLLLPVIVLHVNYLNSEFRCIRVEQNKLTINNYVYTDNDIEKIKIYATSQHFKNYVGAYALPYNDYYYYIELNLKNGEEINLPSLFDYKIDEIFKQNFSTVEMVEKPSSFMMLLMKKKMK